MSAPFSMSELLTATNNFSPDTIIGEASRYLVYKGQLSNGLTVAIKKYDPTLFSGFREIRAQVETLGSLRHPNIIRLLGYCASGSEQILVYQFLEKGKLRSWLHPNESNHSSRLLLSWETRLKIVRGVADGLAYLHGLEKPIIHRDIKPSAVLLDSEFEAHIADFGLARTMGSSSHSHSIAQVDGTLELASEYVEGSMKARVKGDVYCFGILMLETMTGRPEHVSYRGMHLDNTVMDILDPKISWESLVQANVREYFRIASLCANNNPADRPAMREVVQMLNQIPL